MPHAGGPRRQLDIAEAGVQTPQRGRGTKRSPPAGPPAPPKTPRSAPRARKEKKATAPRALRGGRGAAADRTNTGTNNTPAGGGSGVANTSTNNTPAGGGSGVANTGAGAGGASYYGPLAAVDSPLVSDQVNNHARPWFTQGGVGGGLRMYLDWQDVAGGDISAEDLAEDLDFSEMFSGLLCDL